MKKFPLLVIASAVAAALGAPAALAQTSATPSANDPHNRGSSGHPTGARPSERNPTDGRSGGTGMPSSTSGVVPSTEPMASQGKARGTQGQFSQDTVRDVQQALQEKGFDVGPIDGVIGPRTQAALREFQQRQGMSSTGRLDQQTLSALEVKSTGAGVRGSDASSAGGATTPSGRAGG